MQPAPYDFTGKTALITGAASGFGLATAQQLAGAGARIIGVDRNRDKLVTALAALPAKAAAPHHVIVVDLRPAASAEPVIIEAFQVAGHVDILVNSAGVCHFNRLGAITSEEWDEVLEIDLRTLFFLSVAFAERVDPARGARIINLGSNAGRKGRAMAPHYAAAKAGVANLSESLALAYGSKNITANTVCPAGSPRNCLDCPDATQTPRHSRRRRQLDHLPRQRPRGLHFRPGNQRLRWLHAYLLGCPTLACTK